MGKKKANKSEGPESAKSWAPQFIQDFLASDKAFHQFETSLTNIDRGTIHNLCRSKGIKSKSSGTGENRRLKIFKSSKKISKSWKKIPKISKRLVKKSKEKEEKLQCVSFPPEAKPVLQDLFTRYPPCDRDTSGTSLGVCTGHYQHRWKDEFFGRPQLKKNDIQKEVASMRRKANNKGFREILQARTKLPIASFEDAITSAVESNQVVLIAGETGCGKTTQVPQYLLDHTWQNKQTSCKIICTQPRRISAISVSERIAWERGETIGNSVGYKVRLQSKGGRQTSVVFCTNGILLRVLVGKGNDSCLSDITHIIVDEIHERDCYSDFMLAIIREFLPTNPHLRLILMSATLDAERFSGYFGGCPVVRVPGFTYPVRTFYLDDVLSFLESDKENHLVSGGSNLLDGKPDISDEDKAALDEAIDLAWKNDDFDSLLDLVSSEGSQEVYNYRQSSTWLTPLMVFAGKGMVTDVRKLLLLGADCKLKSKEGITALELAEKELEFEAARIIREHSESNSQKAQGLLDKYMASINAEEVDVGLIVRLMRKICSDSEAGAILVFLPGWEEISRTKEKLLADCYFKKDSKFKILCLHSRVPADEQKKVFQRPGGGCRKIVLATNIAESAVTIDDVVYVIDSGRMKEKSYDPFNDISTLQSSWVSMANAKQREGRAGRCQPGICYHLYSKLRAASLPEYRVPEVRRMQVDELCLQVKMLDPSCSVNDFLQKLMDPPVDQSIANALIILKEIGGLTPQEELTELGLKFGQLPVHPRISKMLYFSILVNCLDPALILACAADTKDPFTMPVGLGERKKAVAAKHELASLYGGQSDHLAIVVAFQCWKNSKSSRQSAEFCSQYFLSVKGMKTLDDMRGKLYGELKRLGVIPSDDSNCNLNAHDPGILRAVLAAGLYPMVGRMCQLDRKNNKPLVETSTGAKVSLLSKPVSSTSRKDNEVLIVFDEITRGDWDVHIRSCTAVPPIPLLLFSGEIAVAPIGSRGKIDDDKNHVVENVGDATDTDKTSGGLGEEIMLAPENSVKVIVDRWLPFKITAFEIAQFYILRERLIASILFRVKHPRKSLPLCLGASMYAIACILSYDGLPKPSVQTVAVEPIAPVVDATALGDDMPSSNPNESQENDLNIAPVVSKLESADTPGLSKMEESLPSSLTDENAQVVDATVLRDGMPSSNPDGSWGNDADIAPVVSKLESAKTPDLSTMEESLPSNLHDENAQVVDATGLRDEMPSSNPNGSQEDNSDSTPIVSKLESANTPGLIEMEESLSSNLANENAQVDPRTGPMEDVSAVQSQKKKPWSKRSKPVNNEIVASAEEDNKPSDLAVKNEQSDPTTAPMEASSAAKLPMEDVSAVQPQKKKRWSKRSKPVNNQIVASAEDDKPSDLAVRNEQSDPNTAPMEASSAGKLPEMKQSKFESVNNMIVDNAEDNKPSDLAVKNEQSGPTTTPTEAAAEVKQPKKKRQRSRNSKSANKPDSVKIEEESLPPNLTNGNEQPNLSTAPTEATSAAQQPEPKKSKKKKKV